MAAKFWSSIGAAPGGYPGPSRFGDFYYTSESIGTILQEEEHMCIFNVATRSLVTINPTPDAADTFSAKLRNNTTGPTTVSGSNLQYAMQEQVWMYVDQNKLPLLISSFPSTTTAICDSSVIGSFIGTGFDPDPITFQARQVIYHCRFVRIALTSGAFGTWAGGMGWDACKKTCSVIIKALFNKNYLGNYPTDTYLRMMKRDRKGIWTDYLPVGSIKLGLVDSEGFIEYQVSGLEPGTAYTAWVVDISASPSDSSTVAENKRKVKTFIATKTVAELQDNLYFWNANALNMEQTACHFYTPFPVDSRKPIRFMAESCFAGTLDGFKDSFITGQDEYHLHVLNGDKYYQDNADYTIPTDYIRHYKALARNHNMLFALKQTGSYSMRDDHEVADNWYRNIVLRAGNVAAFQTTPAETALYNAIMANASLATQVVFRRTNQFPLVTPPNSAIQYAFDAESQFFPARPAGVGVNDSYSIPWGCAEFFFINSNAFLNTDGSVTYFASGVQVMAPGTNPGDFVPIPGAKPQFIPGPSYNFLKNGLKNSKARVKIVIFSTDLKLVFKDKYKEIRDEFFRIAKIADPTATDALIGSTYDKIFTAFNYDNPDGYAEQIEELLKYMDEIAVNNVFFITGDPHVSNVSYMNKKRNHVSCCFSSVGTNRASGYPLLFQGNLDKENAILSLNNNSYGDITIDPSMMTVSIKLRFADEVRGTAEIPIIYNSIPDYDDGPCGCSECRGGKKKKSCCSN